MNVLEVVAGSSLNMCLSLGAPRERGQDSSAPRSRRNIQRDSKRSDSSRMYSKQNKQQTGHLLPMLSAEVAASNDIRCREIDLYVPRTSVVSLQNLSCMN